MSADTGAGGYRAEPAGLDRAELVTYLPRLLGRLAARAALAPVSVVAISFLAGCCAAAWLSGGTRTDILRGVAALLAGYLTGWAGRLMAGQPGEQLGGAQGSRPISRTAPGWTPTGRMPAGRTPAGRTSMSTASAELSAAPAELSPASAEVRAAQASRAAAGRARALGGLAAVAAEYAVLAGLAAGAGTPQWHRPWELATVVAILISLRTTLRACRGRPVASKIWPPGADRIAIIAVAAPLWGTEGALLGLAAWEIGAVCYALAPRRRGAGEISQASEDRASQSGAAAGHGGTGWGILSRDADAGEPSVSVGLSLLTPAPEWRAATAGPYGQEAEPIFAAGPKPDLAASLLHPDDSQDRPAARSGNTLPLRYPGDTPPARKDEIKADAGRKPAPAGGRSPESLARCRDDGAIARWLGRPMRGNLAALPPAIAGLAATATVAVLGLNDLPGPLVLTPVVAMLLAAAGSSYRHAARPDWLVPAVLQAGQFLFIGAAGFGRGVPAPVTFALCVMIALHYSSLAGPAELATGSGRQAGRQPAGRWQSRAGHGWPASGGLGWDGRMIVIGLSALAGVTMFAYLALTAYLGVLICSKIMTICHTEGVGR